MPITPLIGREQSVKEVSTLLLRPEVRLLTLTGAGGIGKTRIALQVINEVQQGFADGCYFIPLASITEPDLVPYTIMRFLDAPMRKDLAVSKQLQAHLQAKNALLVLDNFEHLIPATPLVTALLAACPTIKLLITSRVSLHLSGEREIAVPPLALPELGALPELAKLSAVDSIALFVQRAGAVKRDFYLTPGNARSIAEICTRLDGLPLALELAAARIKLLSPQALLIRLDSRLDLLNGGGPDLPVRHQALRNTLDWSYQLLNREEQLLFQRLAVFVGGCTSEAVAALYSSKKPSVS
jgi:predicted ATPase